MSSGIYVEKGNNSDKECDNLNDSQINEYKELVYKFFQFQTYKVNCSNGDFGCPFCDYKEEHRYQYVHLLLHAIRVGEGSENGKQRANHFAMARYLVIDLADEFKAEADRLSKGEMDAIDKVLHLERELNEKADEMNDLITKERQINDELQRARRELIEEKALNNLLKEKLKENEDLKSSNQNLLAREQKSNAELQGVRKELIKGLNDWQSGNKSGIGIKQMGEIDVNVFKRVCSKRFRRARAEIIAKGVCNLWQKKLENPQWHPFRTVEDDMGNSKIVVSEEDESLRSLKQTRGDEVYNEVVTALKDLYEYNPSRSHTVAEIWNFGENRKAKLEEVISYVFTQSIRQSKRKRTT